MFKEGLGLFRKWLNFAMARCSHVCACKCNTVAGRDRRMDLCLFVHMCKCGYVHVCACAHRGWKSSDPLEHSLV